MNSWGDSYNWYWVVLSLLRCWAWRKLFQGYVSQRFWNQSIMEHFVVRVLFSLCAFCLAKECKCNLSVWLSPRLTPQPGATLPNGRSLCKWIISRTFCISFYIKQFDVNDFQWHLFLITLLIPLPILTRKVTAQFSPVAILDTLCGYGEHF